MKLILDSRDHHSFNESYHWILEQSGLFEIEKKETVEYSDFLDVGAPIFNRHKYGGISFVRVDGKLIVLDTTFEIFKTEALIETGIFERHKPDLYVKYEPDESVANKIGCPVVNWVMFPGGTGLIKSFEWTGKCDRLATLASGKNSLRILGRTPWFDLARAREDLFNVYVACSQKTYRHSLQRSQWGVILSKRRDKNTREYEFVSSFMPMALNYRPVYPFPFEPDVHYAYMEKPDDLMALIDRNPIPFHTRSVQLWENYFRPDMAARLLLSNLL